MTDRYVERFTHERWTAGVVGLGYVGLPLALTAADSDLDVIGYDASSEVVAELRAGRTRVDDVDGHGLRARLEGGLEVTDDPGDLARADAIFVCVPSPLGRNREPDLSYLRSAAETVAAHARPGQLVSLESTTYPGTTEELFLPPLETRGLALDEDVFLAYSPERVDPGNPLKTGDIPKVVGGVSPASTRVAVAAYGRLVRNVHPVSSARAAELTKLLENTYRAVNIALVNELAQIAHALDIDIWEVITAASTKPFGYQPFWPGPGVGGHCIPLDPQYLAWRAREHRMPTRFIDLAEEVNLRMPSYVVDRAADVLNRRGEPVFGSPILGIGIAYKPNVSDARESPAMDVLRLLERRGAELEVIDPHVGDEGMRAHGLVPFQGDDFSRFRLAIVLTDHDEIDLQRIADSVPVVLDTRGAFRRRGLVADNVEVL